ncbi:putative DNA metabolism protein [Kineothrix alysoides]|uniref:Putative DNA metabolism protein n=1 Tax=Kineothrix alysoides TaxID=1469948 RepID=A0A4V2QCI8_9FIRM|nr:TIGR03915 family putative DNA repair protein [Kineothrix alysoides]TCL60437.1 putative DNA metabolism protein [Kineothrix alysoides]
MEEKYLICEDSLEGIFTGIYKAYSLKADHSHLHIQIGEEENLRLFAEYIPIEPDAGMAVKVSRTIQRELGEETYMNICRALASEDKQKGEAVYKTVVCGLQMKNGRQVMGNLANSYVHKVFELSRGTNNEVLHLMGFLRFQELENGILFSRIGPKNNIVTFLAPHFADRLPLTNFVIYDENRGIFAVHPASKDWYLVTDAEISREAMENYSKEELEYQELFTYFCHKIAIKERRNLNLQKSMLPLRFQEYMVEFRK